jgi:O-antigen ligase
MSETSAALAEEIGKGAARIALPVVFAGAIILGGASQSGYWANGALQAASALILAICILTAGASRIRTPAILLLAIFGGFLVLALAQLVPLPDALWRALPARAFIAEGFAIVGAKPGMHSLSLAPQETLAGLFRWLPPLAAFLIVATQSSRRVTAYLPWTIVLLAAGSVALGLAQVFAGRDSPLYFYDPTNWGQPVGFMANVNHQASFLVMSLPFVALLLSRQHIRGQMGDADTGQMLLIGALGLFICLGVLIAGSVAGYALMGPAILIGVLIFRGGEGRKLTPLILLGAALGVGVLGFVVANSPILTGLGVTDFASTGTMSRADLYARTTRAIVDYLPLGSGLGSFEGLFPHYEDPNLVTSTFANHAHSDYLEFVLELGLPGAALLLAVVLWWVVRSIQIWTTEGEEDGRLRRAASIAVGLVIVHSLVDYPLRTAAVATFTALCLGLMAGSPSPPRKTRKSDAATPRQHVDI